MRYDAQEAVGNSPGMVLPKHMPALDGLRGVAILLVLLTHVAQGWSGALSIYEDPAGLPPTFSIPSWLRLVASGASHGVQLFFVVSAFTLTVRAREKPGSLPGYALRRLARVGPGYWLAGLVYTCLAGFGPRLWAPDGVSGVDLVVAAVFGSVWRGGGSLAVVPGGWSVCCEVAFYVMLPVILWAARGQVRLAAWLTCASMVIACVWIVYGVELSAFDPVLQAPVFMCGVTAAFVVLQGRNPGISRLPLVLLFAAIVLLPVSPIGAAGFLSQTVFAAISATVVALVAVDPPSFLASPPMRAIGQVSYSMYLVHFALLSGALRAALWIVPSSDWRTMAVHFCLTAAGSFALSCVTYRLIEQPAVRCVNRKQGLLF
jgi:peptidoglycan/LPS O-acetylase OafA/YrhL